MATNIWFIKFIIKMLATHTGIYYARGVVSNANNMQTPQNIQDTMRTMLQDCDTFTQCAVIVEALITYEKEQLGMTHLDDSIAVHVRTAIANLQLAADAYKAAHTAEYGI